MRIKPCAKCCGKGYITVLLGNKEKNRSILPALQRLRTQNQISKRERGRGMNIVDTFKKSCNIFLKADAGIEVPDVSDPVVFLAEVEIIQFDLVGFMVDFEGDVLFIPWGSVRYIEAITSEVNAMGETIKPIAGGTVRIRDPKKIQTDSLYGEMKGSVSEIINSD